MNEGKTLKRKRSILVALGGLFFHSLVYANSLGQALGVLNSVIPQVLQKNTQQNQFGQKPSLLRPQSTSAKYFPECQVPWASTSIPQNACIPQTLSGFIWPTNTMSIFVSIYWSIPTLALRQGVLKKIKG